MSREQDIDELRGRWLSAIRAAAWAFKPEDMEARVRFAAEIREGLVEIFGAVPSHAPATETPSTGTPATSTSARVEALLALAREWRRHAADINARLDRLYTHDAEGRRAATATQAWGEYRQLGVCANQLEDAIRKSFAPEAGDVG